MSPVLFKIIELQQEKILSLILNLRFELKAVELHASEVLMEWFRINQKKMMDIDWKNNEDFLVPFIKLFNNLAQHCQKNKVTCIKEEVGPSFDDFLNYVIHASKYWIKFNSQLVFKDETSFDEIFSIALVPFIENIKNAFPEYRPEAETLLTAEILAWGIILSGTNSLEEVKSGASRFFPLGLLFESRMRRSDLFYPEIFKKSS